MLLGGDFNLPGINWDEEQPNTGSTCLPLSRELIRIASDFSLSQINSTPTRGENILDLLFTSHPSLMKSTYVTPGISDHDILIMDTDLKAQTRKGKPRKIYLYQKGNITGLNNNLAQASSKFAELNSSTPMPLETNWQFFKETIFKAMDEHIPHKMSKSRKNLPWISASIKREIRKKQQGKEDWK